MDIVTQIVIGLCVATVVAGICYCRPAQQIKIILMGGLGSLLPEIDSLTSWEYFDQTIGAWLGFSQTGAQIYFGDSWLGHQGFFHSLLALVFFTGLFWWMASFLYARIMRAAPNIWSAGGYLRPYFVAFALGFAFHLIADLFTPSGAWGGLRLFFPFEVRVGGWGYLWWWNNYDIFLILIGALVINIISQISFSKLSTAGRYMSLAIFSCSILLIGIQIANRDINFNEADYLSREKASHTLQQKMLPPGLYHTMKSFDNGMPVYF